MKNWAQEENNAMKGYILYAAKMLNADSRAENIIDAIPTQTLKDLFTYLHIATDDLTADEAQAYYIKTDF